MVASTHWLASAAGMAVLEQGGNAFDAAVAAGLVLQVVEPHLNGPAGEVPVIGFDAAGGQPFVLDGQGPAPAAATLGLSPASASTSCPAPACWLPACPAAFGTWMLLLERYGTLPLRAVMEYAIGYAEHGYPMLPTASAAIEAVARHIRRALARVGRDLPGRGRAGCLAAGSPTGRWPPSTSASSPRPSKPGRAGNARSRRPGAPSTQGFVAEAIAAYLADAEVMDVTGRRNRGLLTGDDLAGWRASVRGAGHRSSSTA